MMRQRFFLALIGLAIAVSIALFQYWSYSDAQIWANHTALSGGPDATVFNAKQTAFAQPLKNLDSKRRRIFTGGDHLFNTQWVQAPASVTTLDGLGPLFNRNSCSACHFRDGRGRPPVPGEDQLLSKLVRLSIPGQDEHGGPLPHPIYGGQIQEQALLGVEPEGQTKVSWTDQGYQFNDGSKYSLRTPHYNVNNLAYGPLGKDILMSPRVAPAVFGLGLLENIPEANLQAQADPDDADGDGISGRPNLVWDEDKQSHSMGRFGWKANQPTLKQQNASAFNGDMGLTTTLFPSVSCTSQQSSCQTESQYGEQPEVSDKVLEKLTIYVSLLGVPARRQIDANKRGERLFYEAQCNACHSPRQTTGNASPHPEFNHQVIHPYTDLLLHDLGEGLADHRPDYLATGQEWRTAPLWGIGLVNTVNKHTFYLHDGRARNLTEAILWHGGEATAAKDNFLRFSQKDRAALVSFLDSL
jgi:CxxC motif-containing protein (DUF1111 family)